MIQPAVQSGVVNPEHQNEDGAARPQAQGNSGGSPAPAMPSGGPLAGVDDAVSKVSGATQHLNPFQFAKPIVDVAKTIGRMSPGQGEAEGGAGGAAGGAGELGEVAEVAAL